MRVISINLNGIRAAGRKGFYEWLTEQNADFICMQETKAQMQHLEGELYRPKGYHCYFSDAEKKGYSGVGIYSKKKPDNIIHKLGFKLADTEGRYIQVDVGNLSIISLYLPSGSSGEERQQQKDNFMLRYKKHLNQQIKDGRDYILCGDWNIVHKEIDIKNFKPNQKSSGCLPYEREWLDSLFTDSGWVDGFRVINKEAHQYTWWSNRGRSWDNNVGWRIDYQIISPTLKNKVKSASIYKDQRFSDHAPLIIDYQY